MWKWYIRTFAPTCIFFLAASNRPLAAQGRAERPPEQLAASYRLLAQSHDVREQNPGLALLLGIEGHRLAPGRLAREAVARALMAMREERTLFVSPNGVTSAAFSPDGQRIATTANDGWTAIWDSSGALLAERIGPAGSAETVRFFPTGERLLQTSNRGLALLWDPKAAGGDDVRLDHEKGKHAIRDRIAHVAAHGRRIVVGVSLNNGGAETDEVGYVFDAATHREVGRFVGREPAVCADGTRFVTFDYSGKKVLVHRVDPFGAPSEVAIDGSPIGARLSSDGKLVFANAARAIHVHEVESARRLHRIECAEYVRHFEVSSGEQPRLAVVTKSSRVSLYDLATHSLVATIDSGLPAVECLGFSRDGALLACGGADGSIQVVRAIDGAEVAFLRGHELAVTSLCFDPAGERLLSGSADGTARVWRVAGHASVARLADYERSSTGKTAIALEADLLAYAGTYKGGVPIWNLRTGQKLAHVPADHPEHPLFLGGGERLLLRDRDSTRIWSMHEPAATKEIMGSTKNDPFALRPDGAYFAAAKGSTIHLVALPSGAERAIDTNRAVGLAFSNDGQHLFAAELEQRAVACFSVPTGEPVWRTELPAEANRGGMLTAAIAASRQHVAVALGPASTIHILDRQTGQVLKSVSAHTDDIVSHLAFSPTEDRLVSVGGDWTVRLWDAQTWQALSVVRRSRSWSWETWWNHALVSFSPDGLWYAVCFQQERRAQVRSCRDGSLALECRDPGDGVQAMEFDPASSYLRVATRSGEVFRYPAIPILRGQQAKPREFLPSEYAAHVLQDEDPDRTTKLLAYRLQRCSAREFSPEHELALLWQAVVRSDLPSEACRASLAIAQRLARRQSDTRHLTIALGIAHYRCGDLAAAIERLGLEAAAGAQTTARALGEPSEDKVHEYIAHAVRSLCRLASGERDQAAEQLAALREIANDPRLAGADALRMLVDELARAIK